MFDYDDEIEYMDFSEEGFREVQQCLDRFVKVNYETALDLLYRMKPTPEDISVIILRLKVFLVSSGMDGRTIFGTVIFMMILPKRSINVTGYLQLRQ